jgi:Tfp pilus assembly protein FimT
MTPFVLGLTVVIVVIAILIALACFRSGDGATGVNILSAALDCVIGAFDGD